MGYVFRRILRIKSDYSPIGNYLTGLSKGETACVL